VRVAFPLPPDLDPESVTFKTFNGPHPEAEIAHTASWRAATIGAANGHGNARSVAKIQAVISNGGSSHGVQLLPPETIDRVFMEQSNGVDQVLMMPVLELTLTIASKAIPEDRFGKVEPS
jgi:hypothetical protein